MKTYDDFKKADLNYEDLAFFLSTKGTEAKRIINNLLGYGVDEKGKPFAKASDRIPARNIPQLQIKSNSALEGKNRMQIICDAYNRGVGKGTLREWSQNDAFIKAIGFSGSMKLANEILNPEQLIQLQKEWLFANVSSYNHLTKNAEKFIKSNDWAFDFLENNNLGHKLTGLQKLAK